MKNLIFTLLIFTCTYSYSQDKPDQVYTTYFGLKNDKPYPPNIGFSILEENDRTIVIDSFYNLTSGEEMASSDLLKLFALRYKNENYFHLQSYRHERKHIFIKFDITGKYYAYKIEPHTFLYDTTEQTINKNKEIQSNNDLAVSSVGMLGVIAGSYHTSTLDFSKVHSYFLNEEKEKTAVFYIKTSKSKYPKMINYSKFIKLFPKEKELHPIMRKNELNVDIVLELLKNLNKTE